jgi:ketosteroid isomerase-like protein
MHAMHKHRMEQLLRATDAGDWLTVTELFTENAVYELPGRAPVRGRKALLHYYTAHRNIAQGRHTIDGIIADGDYAVS